MELQSQLTLLFLNGVCRHEQTTSNTIYVANFLNGVCRHEQLDNKLGEVGKGDLVIIGARPSMGKTTFAQNLASDMMINQSLPVLFCSIESSDWRLAKCSTDSK